MNSDGSPEGKEQTTQNHPLLVAQRSSFQWAATLNASALTADWQNHLTRYLIASATASVSFEGLEPLHLVEAKVLDDPLNLYQIIVYERAVEVQVYYPSLSQAFMDTPYDCHLLLKTEVGGRFITLPAPRPPGQAEWKQLVKKLWFQLLLEEHALLAISDTQHASAKGQPLYTFRLHPELGWKEADSALSGSALSEWQRELRLVPVPAEPGVLRAQVVWNDSRSFSNPLLESVAISETERSFERGGQARKQQVSEASGKERVTQPLLIGPLPGQERRWSISRARLVALIAAVFLLVVIGGVALGATRGTSGTNPPLAGAPLSPTASLAPSATASATTAPTGLPTTKPTAQPTPAATNQPGFNPTPTPTSKPGVTPSPTPTPTPTPSPTPTPTPTPTDTPTPSPTPTDTPTPPIPTDTPTPTTP